MTAARPGGWVDGIGWVALLHDVIGTDAWCADDAAQAGGSPEGWTSYSRDHVDYNRPVIVTRWADGTTPAAPDIPQAEGDRMSGREIANALHAGHQVQQWSDGKGGCDSQGGHWCDLADPDFWLDHIGDRVVIARIAAGSGTGDGQ